MKMDAVNVGRKVLSMEKKCATLVILDSKRVKPYDFIKFSRFKDLA
jgi:hypothetical protein